MCVGLSLGFLSCCTDVYFCFCASTILSFFKIISTFNYYLFIYLFILAVLGLCFCARASSSCGRRGPLFITVRGPLTIMASLVAEHRIQTRRLSSCGSRAQLLCGMWDLPRLGLEPVSPALAGRFSTTAPPGKPPYCLDYCSFVVQSEVREPDSSSSVFLSQDCFGQSVSFMFPYKL